MRLRRPDASVLLRLGGSLSLLVLMIATRWFGLSRPAHGAFGAAGSTAAGAWGMLHLVRWLLLLAIVTAPLSVAVRSRAMAAVALGLGLIATGGLFLRLLIALPDPAAVLDVKVGGYLALIASAALTLGAWEAPVPARVGRAGDVRRGPHPLA